MKKTLLILSTVFSSMAFGQTTCSELFISEYVEGWSNNKALEIYNPTANSINLNQYMVVRYSNGATSATAANAIQLTGTIGAYSTYVAVLDKQDPNGTGQEAPVWDSLQARADGFYCPVYTTSNAFYWNGNDAVVLAKGTVSNIAGSVAVDIFGKIGEDPGAGWSTAFPYTGAGVVVTADHSLIRKATVLVGETNPNISFFDPLLKWDSIPAVIVRLDANGDTIVGGTGNPILDGNWKSLGTHVCNCDPSASITEKNPSTELTVYPNPTNGIVYVKGAALISKIQVYNSLGQIITTLDNNSKQVLTLDLGNYKGLYLLKMTDENGSQITKRVIVK